MDQLQKTIRQNPGRILSGFPSQWTEAKQFKDLLLHWHPDKYRGGDRDFANEVTQLINEAKDKLGGQD